MAKPKPSVTSNLIVQNRSARHEYEVISHLEAGISLQGWEVKSLRAKKIQIKDAYVVIQNNQACLLNALITPLATTCAYQTAAPDRTRVLLLHRREIAKLKEAAMQEGYTLIPLQVYWHKAFIKVRIGLCKGKKAFDKRAALKERDWTRTQQALIKRLR